MSYFNKDTAEKIVTQDKVSIYRLRSGKYVLYDSETGRHRRVDYTYFKEFIGRLSDRKLKKVLAEPEDKRINLNIRLPLKLRETLWTLAESEGLNMQRYVLRLIEEHVAGRSVPIYKRKKAKKRRSDENNK